MSEKIKFKAYSTGQKIFLIGLIIWVFLQISRLIAIPLINDIQSGVESPAWMYPAYLDLFAAFLALPLIAALMKWRGLFTWTVAIIYLVISIVDHTGNFVTTTIVGPPSIVEEGMNPYLVPAIQTLLDLVFLVLLSLPNYRRLFFKMSTDVA